MALLVSGTVALDTIKTPLGYRRNMLGGSAAHFCMSAAFFQKVHLVGVIGKNFSRAHLELLKKKRIDLSALQKKNAKTFAWSGEYKKGNLDNALTLKTELGVLQNFDPILLKDQKKISCVFLANDDPVIQEKVLSQLRRPRLVGLDSMNLWINIRKTLLLRLLQRVDIFFVNEGEAKMLTGESHLIKAVKALRTLGPKQIVLKKGEHGVLFYSDQVQFAFPAYPVETVIDPTGAGDPLLEEQLEERLGVLALGDDVE